MGKQPQTFFLEEWLRSNSGNNSTINTNPSSSSSARAIIQAWAELRDCLQKQSFQSHHLHSLKTLLNSQNSLYVADPQAKLLLSILSSQNLYLPNDSYPIFLRLLYIWVRKSSKPNTSIVNSAVEVMSYVVSMHLKSQKSALFFSESVLLLGAVSFVPSLSESLKKVCLEILCVLLEDDYKLIGSFEVFIPDVLAGIGYALFSSNNPYFVRILDFSLGIWGKEGGFYYSVLHGLMILHLVEWVISGLISSRSMEKIGIVNKEFFDTEKKNYAPFAVVMCAAGILRACNMYKNSLELKSVLKLRILAEDQIESVARLLVSAGEVFTNSTNDPTNRLLLQCISIALARSGLVASRAPFFLCLASALLVEIFPLQRFYTKVCKFQDGTLAEPSFNRMIKEHINSVLFKEAGAITGAFCNQYALADEESKVIVENNIWSYCQNIYLGHRQVALALKGEEDELLGDLEKIAESAFLMIVLFALSVTKHRLHPKFTQEAQIETSVTILVSFSCVEYFRRIRLPEYMDTIRGVVVSVQENESACVSFIQSMPSYHDLTNKPDVTYLRRKEYVWYKDDVQTSRMLFYLRVIPTGIERLPTVVFERIVAPTMFLYMGHPNRKVAGASHSMFVSYISSGEDSYKDDRASSKEQLVFYYIQRSLEGYPGITPFDGMASGVAALSRHLPAGSPAMFFCIHSLVDKANTLCNEASIQEADFWKNWQGESEPCKQILDLLLRLLPLVDIQVLPSLMKLLAPLIVSLPKDGQTILLNELHTQVAESDDVTRKPALVSWVQSLSYLVSKSTGPKSPNRTIRNEDNTSGINARL